MKSNDNNLQTLYERLGVLRQRKRMEPIECVGREREEKGPCACPGLFFPGLLFSPGTFIRFPAQRESPSLLSMKK